MMQAFDDKITARFSQNRAVIFVRCYCSGKIGISTVFFRNALCECAEPYREKAFAAQGDEPGSAERMEKDPDEPESVMVPKAGWKTGEYIQAKEAKEAAVQFRKPGGKQENICV